MRKRNFAVIALTLACALCVCIVTGCSQDNVQTVAPGEHVAADSPWIDSDIAGAVVPETQVRLQDDFFTAVNKDWIVETTLPEGVREVGSFANCQAAMEKQLMDIASGAANVGTGQNSAGVPAALVQHDEVVIKDFSALAKDWTERNKLGVEPLRPYLDTIKSLNSVDDLTRFILSDKESLTGPLLVGVKVGPTEVDHSQNVVQVTNMSSMLLPSTSDYDSISQKGSLQQEANAQKLFYVLGRLGYSDSDISSLLSSAYAFEIKLAHAIDRGNTASSVDLAAQMEASDNRYSWDDLVSLQGAFPLTDLLAQNGYRVNEVSVENPEYVKELGALCTAENLPLFKAWYTVRTALGATELLDQDTYQFAQQIDTECQIKQVQATSSDGDERDTDEGNRTNDQIALDLLQQYLSGPLGQVYVARYCTADQKAQITAMIDQFRDAYRVMLSNETWLSDQTRAEAIAKLDKMTVRVLYPDTFKDYSGLSLEGSTTLLQAVAAVNHFQFGVNAQRVGQPVDLSYWDLETMPTTTANAYYIPKENSMNIFAGFLADGMMYDENASIEENFAGIGDTIGHEMSHAFDDNGAEFDADGQFRNWWTNEDKIAFQQRTADVKRYFSTLTPYPGAAPMDGAKVTGEAIADITGMQVLLNVVRDNPQFDYERFFKAHAETWRLKRTFEREKEVLARDVHPLAYLRTNVVVMQFDEFLNTFGVVEGDGMYLPADKRILVW